MYIKDGIKIHVRQMKSVILPEGTKDSRVTIRPTLEQMREYNIEHFKGKQYKYLYFLCDKKTERQLREECLIDLDLPRPKDNDLQWKVKSLDSGKWVKSTKPPYTTDIDQRTKDIVKL